MTEEKIRENRLRRMAERQGLALNKSRRRDQRALDYGRWHILDASTGDVVIGGDGFTTDEVEAYLVGRSDWRKEWPETARLIDLFQYDLRKLSEGLEAGMGALKKGKPGGALEMIGLTNSALTRLERHRDGIVKELRGEFEGGT